MYCFLISSLLLSIDKGPIFLQLIAKTKVDTLMVILVHLLANFHVILPITNYIWALTLGQVLCAVCWGLKGQRWDRWDLCFHRQSSSPKGETDNKCAKKPSACRWWWVLPRKEIGCVTESTWKGHWPALGGWEVRENLLEELRRARETCQGEGKAGLALSWPWE